MGMTFEQGHFFAMFVSVLAFLTPPVAIVSLIAARVANADYIKTSIESTKAALGGFLLPFIFAFCPLLLWQPQKVVFESFGLVACILLIISFEGSFIGYYLARSNWMERLWQFATGVVLFLFIMLGSYLYFIAGAMSFTVFTAYKWKRSRGVPKLHSAV
jgi:TRAP-type uncharacterized transport system fused permease subunit